MLMAMDIRIPMGIGQPHQKVGVMHSQQTECNGAIQMVMDLEITRLANYEMIVPQRQVDLQSIYKDVPTMTVMDIRIVMDILEVNSH